MRILLFCLFLCCFLHIEAQQADFLSKQRCVENGLRPKIFVNGKEERFNLLDRMKFYKIPAVSIAVINNGKVEWSKGYGNVSIQPESQPVNDHTLFQAASVSKPITALGALILVQQGRISLDDDVNLYLKRWKVPENEFTRKKKVTLRELLSHTAGTNVSGFPGYSVNDPIPTLMEVLEGKKPYVNTDPVRVIAVPGTEVKYSGGGTTIVQLLIEDITGDRFDVWMQNNVLKTLGMNESSFALALPKPQQGMAAHGHQLHGKPVLGNWHIYPELAAAGLWTTPKDLAQYVIYVQSVLQGNLSFPLNRNYVEKMITRQRKTDEGADPGLGPFLMHEGKDLVFMHNGQNEGFNSRVFGFACKGKGVVIMMNSDAGWPLMEEITNSIADNYNWPHFAPIVRQTVPIDPASFHHVAGRFTHEEEQIDITVQDDRLFIDFNNGFGPMRLFPFGKCKFFVTYDDITIDFSDCDKTPESVQISGPLGTKKTYRRRQ